MGKRFGYYEIKSHINEIWNKTLKFCQNHKAKIKIQFISSNTLYRELKVKYRGSIRPYGSTFSETYELTFGYHPYEKITYVSIKIKFITARGFSGLVPQDNLKKWAREIGTEPIKLTRRQDQTFSDKYDEICNLTGQEHAGQPLHFCPTCGNPNSLIIDVCVECGIKFDHAQ